MQEIKVHDVDLFISFLKSITRLADACEFNFTPEKTIIRVCTESKSVRAIFETDCATSDDNCSFCLCTLQNLHKSFVTMRKYLKKNELKLKFDGQKLSHRGKASFSFNRIEPIRIKNKIDTVFPSHLLEDEFGFILNTKDISNITSLSNVCSSECKLVYFSKNKDENDEVFIEALIDNKGSKNTDSISIPVTNNYYGNWNQVIVVDMEMVRLFNIVPSDEINISMTNKKVGHITSSNISADGNYKNILNMYIRLLEN